MLAIGKDDPQAVSVSLEPLPVTRNHWPVRVPPPLAFAEPVSATPTWTFPSPMDAAPPSAALSVTVGFVLAVASCDQPLLPTLFRARTRTS